MNYKSQLNGWAVEMVIKGKDAGFFPDAATFDDLLSLTKQLVEYAYTPRKDLEDHVKDLFEMVRNAPEGESPVDSIIATLDRIRFERVGAGLEKAPEQNNAPETIQ